MKKVFRYRRSVNTAVTVVLTVFQQFDHKTYDDAVRIRYYALIFR